MRTGQAIIENHSNFAMIEPASTNGGFSGWLTRLFGCRHEDLGRPLSIQGQTYRTCLDCGARRQFNVGRWEMQGDFYYRVPASSHLRPISSLAGR